MNRMPLVIDEIEAGWEFIKRMNHYLPVKAAWWFQDDFGGRPSLYVALEGLTDANSSLANYEIMRIAQDESFEHYIHPLWVRLVGLDHRAARDVLEHYRAYPRRVPARIDAGSLGGVSLADVYVYQPLYPRS